MAITAKISMTISANSRLSLGFQTKAANIPLHALIMKLMRSPVKTDIVIVASEITPAGMATVR